MAAETPTEGVPAHLNQVTWQGLRFRYNPQNYAFAETRRDASQVSETLAAQAVAHLIETPNLCLGQAQSGSDCFPREVCLAVYPSQGLDVWTWLAQTSPRMFWWPGREHVTETMIAGYPAIAWNGDGIRASEMTYVVPLGAKIFLIDGTLDETVITSIQLGEAHEAQLAPGAFVMTRSDREWDLWTDAIAGSRVHERPRLYGGALVTILGMQDNAVHVRTVDNVVGWIHAAAHEALTTDVRMVGPQEQFLTDPSRSVQVVHNNAIPLRARPHSEAVEVGEPIAPGQAVRVLGVCGDWLEVSGGWVRWFYDGADYLDLVQP